MHNTTQEDDSRVVYSGEEEVDHQGKPEQS